MVLAGNYAIARRNGGGDVAEMRFKKLADSGLKFVPLSPEMARDSGRPHGQEPGENPLGRLPNLLSSRRQIRSLPRPRLGRTG